LPGAFVFEIHPDRESTSDNRLAWNGTNVWAIYKGGRKSYGGDVAAGVACHRLIDARAPGCIVGHLTTNSLALISPAPVWF
jgi:hypothetical protein